MKNYILVVAFLSVLIGSIQAQDYNFGIRAGLNYSKFLGPTIDENATLESYTLNNGLHFGITLGYYFTDMIGITTELGYSQIGTKYKYEGDSYYIFNYNNERHPLPGQAERIYDINNAYINIPLLFSFKPHKKWEFQIGPYVQFLVVSKAAGKLEFTSPNEDLEPYSFIQSIDANYYGDNPGEQAEFSNSVVRVCLEKESIDDVTCPEDKILVMPRVVGGYYEFQDSDKDGSLYNWLDAGINGSVSYFINNSLYTRITAQYGLMDVTNDDMDVDYRKLNENQRFIYQDDKDFNLNIAVSLGFKF